MLLTYILTFYYFGKKISNLSPFCYVKVGLKIFQSGQLFCPYLPLSDLQLALLVILTNKLRLVYSESSWVLVTDSKGQELD